MLGAMYAIPPFLIGVLCLMGHRSAAALAVVKSGVDTEHVGALLTAKAQDGHTRLLQGVSNAPAGDATAHPTTMPTEATVMSIEAVAALFGVECGDEDMISAFSDAVAAVVTTPTSVVAAVHCTDQGGEDSIILDFSIYIAVPPGSVQGTVGAESTFQSVKDELELSCADGSLATAVVATGLTGDGNLTVANVSVLSYSIDGGAGDYELEPDSINYFDYILYGVSGVFLLIIITFTCLSVCKRDEKDELITIIRRGDDGNRDKIELFDFKTDGPSVMAISANNQASSKKNESYFRISNGGDVSSFDI